MGLVVIGWVLDSVGFVYGFVYFVLMLFVGVVFVVG